MLGPVELYENCSMTLLEGAIAHCVRPAERAALVGAARGERGAVTRALGMARLGEVRGWMSPSTPAEREGLVALGAAAWSALPTDEVDRLRAHARRALADAAEVRPFVRELGAALARPPRLGPLLELGLGSVGGRAFLAEHRVEALLPDPAGLDHHERGGASFRAVQVASRRRIELWVGDGDVKGWFERALRLEGPFVAGPRELFEGREVTAAVFDPLAGRPLAEVAPGLSPVQRLDLARSLVRAARPLAAAGLLTPHLTADAWLEGAALRVAVRPRAAFDPDRAAARGRERDLLLHGSPERLMDPYHRSAQADVYEVASVVFLVLTGRPALEGQALEALVRAKQSPPALPSELPRSLGQALVDCLQPDPSLRPPDLEALETNLR